MNSSYSASCGVIDISHLMDIIEFSGLTAGAIGCSKPEASNYMSVPVFLYCRKRFASSPTQHRISKNSHCQASCRILRKVLVNGFVSAEIRLD